MPAERLHLVRHGEVHNPQRVLYGRLPNFRLSDDGRRMAQTAAEHVRDLGRPIASITASPLQRAQESAEPFADLFGLPVGTDERIIEPTNVFEGRRMRQALMNPMNWHHLRAPAIPSWGEPYLDVVARMLAAMRDAAEAAPLVDGVAGDVVLVSHQLPIWITHLALAEAPLRHDPRQRRCALSSVTTFERDGDGWREIAYVAPAAAAGAVDVGAV
ncbi:MAG: histidine phosphatase family protein [Candidatus Microbacterium phytovorans]|uniref:Histidine phosphatase family protein n=1 Tax=Candidatus Microbacterium phytovorans TaxID=3121374 RepID=A0AAJ5VZ77_9MICO|nr:histidine phosphatase family protein [Microbacterium sp.]WEK12595.1 MAG: histidine phosphatase family protein [Microbacterium sp.]